MYRFHVLNRADYPDVLHISFPISFAYIHSLGSYRQCAQPCYSQILQGLGLLMQLQSFTATLGFWCIGVCMCNYIVVMLNA